ncbi:homoserine dehydrogenase [Clostridium botulinum]|uniref:homoserine dehydrogenase n=1 Tax=Clostridium botulinum TaxID=1491 RepID=UPI0004D8F250|nr:homoserine dehydrogenase [Clostridium botulinum]KEI01972.1 homoserine dehydrogenase [Clostridium botulinum C/D str. BKT75002]KEI10074.1 homoserine dehydrogenase [Clostridium botulinum C/D str. BKT2873]KGM98171.1 homoserine dehydrogenase [Clostridium botulinum D str. CCUG 7971]KOC50380.1 homoserine dehydrogenase [Clostridium botulinum]MCD3351104.1 homoserine dehydrogenase [Clostridium botulinum D/C]
MKKVNIAILGLGNVGRGVWKILNANKEEIKERSGYDIEVSKILVRDINKDRGVEIPKDIITTNPEEIFQDNNIKVILELMGGVSPAKEYMIRAMKNKKHVVTANKMVLATEGAVLSRVAQEEGVRLCYEASVAGGIPIIHGLTESLTANKIEQIIGIINGTTNYILTKMHLDNMDFTEALKEAQEKGYAEADPTSDVEGYDAVYKLGILTYLAFGKKVNVSSIYREGIQNIESIDIDYAKEFGYVIKLLAIVKDIDNTLELRVHPTMIPERHPLANVNDSFNAIFLKGNAVGDLMMYGRGAGDLPTGSAVVGDLISVLRNETDPLFKLSKHKLGKTKKVNNMEQTECEYYIRITVKDEPGVLGKITTILGDNSVSLLSVIQKGKGQNFVNLVFVTHKTLEGNINNSIDTIKTLSSVKKIENIIRVEKLQ